MMRKLLQWGSLLILALAAFALVAMARTELGDARATSTPTFAAFPEGQVRILEFDVNGPSYQALSPREKTEQQRDWVMFALVSSSGMPAVAVEQALSDMPPVRADTLAHLGQAETGESRSRTLGSERPVVIAAVPKADPRAQADLLADVVDEQRKNSGDIPTQVYVFEYELLPDGDAARVIARGARSGKELFEDKAGYVETTLRSTADLERFLKATDDVVAARLDGGTLVVGGRKFASRRLKGVGVEEIASIWKSSARDPDLLGFSLDPALDRGKLREIFAKVGVSAAASSPDELLGQYRAALRERFAGRFPDEAIDAEFQRIVQESQFQKARYDGAFQGTEVGMVLFYTDLLMKLWGQDKLRSTPREIVEFPNKLQLNPSSVHQQELERMRGTRLWLGPKETAMQKDPSGRALYLARVATRLFAVPHDVIDNKDLKEAEPNIFNRSYINWWNRHYAEVAQYEPQYDRLNQIMKWSAIIGWLRAQESGSALGMLADVTHMDHYWFPDWAKDRSELTFRGVDKIGFHPRGYAGSTTEAMEIQYSEPFEAFGSRTNQFSGGVSLGGKKSLEKMTPLSRELDAASRRAGISATKTETGAWKIVSAKGNALETSVLDSGAARSVIKPGPTVRLRGTAGELKAAPLERRLVRDAQRTTVRLRSGDVALGELQIEPTGRGLRVGWQARDLDTAYAIARDVSRADTPGAVLASHPDVAGVIGRGDGTFVAQLRGSNQWVRFGKRTDLSEAIAGDGVARVSAGPTAPIVDVELVKSADIQVRLTGLQYVEVRGSGSARGGISLVEAARPPPQARPTPIEIGGRSVEAFTQGDRTFINWDALPMELRTNLSRLTAALDRRPPTSLPMADAFSSRSYPRIADAIGKDPVAFRKAVHESVDAELRHNLALWQQGRVQELEQRMTLLQASLPDVPELRIQRALIQLEQGKSDAAARTLGTAGGGRSKRPSAFIDELEARARDTRLTPERRADLQALADFAELTKRSRPGTSIGAEVEQGRLRVRYEADEVKKAPYTLPDEASLQRAAIYMEDSLKLNNVDVTPSTTPSQLKDWIQSRRVEVLLIQDTDLATFNPGLLVERTAQKQYRLVRSGAERVGSNAARVNCQQQTSTDASTPPCVALIVRERPAAAPRPPTTEEWHSPRKTG